jgi:threonine dehydrogenase-like Zn-dependent dehydrogenase
MRQAILYGKDDLRLEEQTLDLRSLQSGMVYVETEVSALSTGTDLGNYLGNSTYVPGAPDYPRPVGYSNVGAIRRVGDGVKSLRPGLRVFSMKSHQSAFLAQQDELLIPVPEIVSSEEASLAYLTHLGLASLRQARFEPGENIVVVGLGVIGLCTVGLAGAIGAKVVGIANSALRSEAAKQVGAHDAFLSEDPDLKQKLEDAFGEVGPDIVVLTANQWEAYRLSVAIARYAGRVSVLGFPGRLQPKPDFNPLDPEWFYGKQLTLLGAGFAPRSDCPPQDLRFNVRRNLQYILELMAARSLRLESLITHRLPSSRMKEAYELAKQHDKSLIAAVFDWRADQ